MNPFLIAYTAIGPTFRARVVENFKHYPALGRYDVLILTDMPEDVVFNTIRNLSNVHIDNIHTHREQYSEFLPYEHIPVTTTSDIEYKNSCIELLSKVKPFPIHLHRFVLNYKDIGKYSHIILCDCDVVPTHSDERYEEIKEYLFSMPMNSVSSYSSIQPQWDDVPVLHEFANKMIDKFNIVVSEPNRKLLAFDNPFKVLRFESAVKISQFFTRWNTCLLELYEHGSALEKAHILPGSWQLTPEPLHAILFKLEDMTINGLDSDFISLHGFTTCTYPEDRWWNGLPGFKFDMQVNSQAEFIQKNYELLKTFYQQYHQPFTYQRVHE